MKIDKLMILRILTFGKCWLYGFILLYGIDLVKRFSEFIDSKSASPFPEIMNAIIVVFGPFLLFLSVRDYSKIKVSHDEYVEANPFKSVLWAMLILFIIIFIIYLSFKHKV